MKRPAIGKALVLCAALSLPALAAAPAGAADELPRAEPCARDRASTRRRRPDARKRTWPREPANPCSVHTLRACRSASAWRLTDGATIAPRTQVLHARVCRPRSWWHACEADPEVEHAEVDARVKRAACPNDPLYAAGSQSTPRRPWVSGTCGRHPASVVSRSMPRPAGMSPPVHRRGRRRPRHRSSPGPSGSGRQVAAGLRLRHRRLAERLRHRQRRQRTSTRIRPIPATG